MKDTVFIQLYSKIENLGWIEFSNGFSDTHDFCKNKGDLIWLKHQRTNHAIDYTEIFQKVEFVIDKGTAYVSASYMSHLYQIYIWALRYPEVKFIVGGPVVLSNCFELDSKLPDNMELINSSVEDYFSIPNFSYPWNIEIPSEIPDESVITYSYTMDNKCYWKKCKFCTLNTFDDTICYRSRQKLDFEFKDLKHNHMTSIRIGADALKPSYINKVVNTLPTFKQLHEYRMFIRCSKKELKVIKSISDFDKMRFTIGIEFPSKKMWKYMDKGYTHEVSRDIIKHLLNNGADVNINIILGWNNLTIKDLREMEQFMTSIGPSPKITVVLYKLFIFPQSELSKHYEMEKELKIGPFRLGFYPKLSEEQKKLDKRAAKFLNKCGAKLVRKGKYD